MRAHRLALKTEDPILEKARAERRRFRRVPVDLGGRVFLPADSSEVACKVVEMSPGGASVECKVIPDTGTPIILYVDGLGRFEGAVARTSDEGFGVRFTSTQLKRERTAEQLALLMNKELLGESDLRRHERISSNALTRFTRSDGTSVKCEVLDLSQSGISLKTQVKPAVGEFVLIGQLAGRIARHHADGVGIEFVGLGPERPTADAIHAKILVR
jgi:PilZ domain